MYYFFVIPKALGENIIWKNEKNIQEASNVLGLTFQ